MSDPRVAKLGALLVNYSLELQPEQLLRIGKAGHFLHEPGLVAAAS